MDQTSVPKEGDPLSQVFDRASVEQLKLTLTSFGYTTTEDAKPRLQDIIRTKLPALVLTRVMAGKAVGGGNDSIQSDLQVQLKERDTDLVALVTEFEQLQHDYDQVLAEKEEQTQKMSQLQDRYDTEGGLAGLGNSLVNVQDVQKTKTDDKLKSLEADLHKLKLQHKRELQQKDVEMGHLKSELNMLWESHPAAS